ncbi:hypothetical protein RRG08_017635 [Elysia crispata]|uniref:EB domain-containing protein n=1 Tax=Elysia crispata TaxID=231223 RepID=A0AAE0ZB39_9GAST|nr:hypothetical protein RRG08_017635 [Elysia crispata]
MPIPRYWWFRFLIPSHFLAQGFIFPVDDCVYPTSGSTRMDGRCCLAGYCLCKAEIKKRNICFILKSFEDSLDLCKQIPDTKMKPTFVYLTLAVALFFVSSVQACPCSSNQCCFLLFNLGALNFKFCTNRNRDTPRCRKSNYCISNSDCPSGSTCSGATVLDWGSCTNC